MNTVEFANSIRNRVFAERDTLEEAYAYARSIADASENPMAVITAVQVVINTLANHIETLEVA